MSRLAQGDADVQAMLDDLFAGKLLDHITHVHPGEAIDDERLTSAFAGERQDITLVA